uniref:Putative secreted protein n=1 Tax=Ixodes scapularis TaxID=6945 RepID=A0A4D5S1G6_IXOSC
MRTSVGRRESARTAAAACLWTRTRASACQRRSRRPFLLSWTGSCRGSRHRRPTCIPWRRTGRARSPGRGMTRVAVASSVVPSGRGALPLTTTRTLFLRGCCCTMPPWGHHPPTTWRPSCMDPSARRRARACRATTGLRSGRALPTGRTSRTTCTLRRPAWVAPLAPWAA